MVVSNKHDQRQGQVAEVVPQKREGGGASPPEKPY